jgi:hypothetical protein
MQVSASPPVHLTSPPAGTGRVTRLIIVNTTTRRIRWKQALGSGAGHVGDVGRGPFREIPVSGSLADGVHLAWLVRMQWPSTSRHPTSSQWQTRRDPLCRWPGRAMSRTSTQRSASGHVARSLPHGDFKILIPGRSHYAPYESGFQSSCSRRRFWRASSVHSPSPGISRTVKPANSEPSRQPRAVPRQRRLQQALRPVKGAGAELPRKDTGRHTPWRRSPRCHPQQRGETSRVPVRR